MVVAKEESSLVYNVRFSSVGAGKLSGQNTIHDPTSMDLAMKLHYLKGVYFFGSQVAEGLSAVKIKATMNTWLNNHYRVLGRFRRSESTGRPYIKCNGCGVRFIEAQSDKTLEEWVAMDWSLHKQLVPSKIIGPELFFSPLVFFQVTHLKGGGISIGLSWSHVLGDTMAASDFINGLSVVMATMEESPTEPYLVNPMTMNPQKFKQPSPLSVQRVDSVGDHWITPNNHKMETFSFPVTNSQLNNLELDLSGNTCNPSERIPVFELICGLIWHCVAKVRQGSEPKLVTICRNDSKRKIGECSNSQVISTVGAADVADSNPKKLAALLLAKGGEKYDEKPHIEEVVENDHGVTDYVVYGGNLTFVNWENADLYGIQVLGQKPVCVNYGIQGVGDEGAVLLLPGPNGEGRVVNVTLPEKEVFRFKAELTKNDLLVVDNLAGFHVEGANLGSDI